MKVMTALRYEWTPASEPPDSERDVLVWTSNESMHVGYFRKTSYYLTAKWHVDGRDGSDDITHWRDVEPPTATPHTA